MKLVQYRQFRRLLGYHNWNRPLWVWFRSKFHLRPGDDDEPRDWWAASTVIPIVAAAVGPLANVMSLAALVSPWKNWIVDVGLEMSQDQIGINDPRWCIALNAVSLVCGVTGNLFLLFKFTQAIRYVVSLPASILLWCIASGILVGAAVAMNKYEPPTNPRQIYSQGYWYAVIAAAIYFFLSFILMINVLGYILGHYPQNFALTDDQRTVILQTMLLSIWLVVGGAVFHKTMGISFADALYFSDVTILTIGFGDIAPDNSLSRGLDFLYAVIGIVILGLVVGSIHHTGQEVRYRLVIKRYFEKRRALTFERSLALSEADHREQGRFGFQYHQARGTKRSESKHPVEKHQLQGRKLENPFFYIFNVIWCAITNHPNELPLGDDKDRFIAIRSIQKETNRFRRTNALVLKFLAFTIVWCCGAAVFWRLEPIGYFPALYFAFCTLTTIGYGDITPSTNATKPFFLVWSLIAVPIVTILVSEMSDTVIASFQHASVTIGDLTVLPRKGAYRLVGREISRLLAIFRIKRVKETAENGFAASPAQENAVHSSSSTHRPVYTSLSNKELAKELVLTIGRMACDLKDDPEKHYTYAEWRWFTFLIQFTVHRSRGFGYDRGDSEIVDWDWIGEDSPMVTSRSESQWVINRLSESLMRYLDHVHEPENGGLGPRAGDDLGFRTKSCVRCEVAPTGQGSSSEPNIMKQEE